ncbi:MAG: hypothetical protein ACLR7Z_10460 [Bilophila wadsworthia]
MPLQSQVNLSVAPGVAGDKATPDQSIYTPLNPLAAVALPVGRFVFPVVDSGVIDNTRATNVAGTATAVLGFVERVINYVNYELLSDGTLTVPAGSNLTVAVKGDYWAVSTTKATVGQAVLASTADGSISTGPPTGRTSIRGGSSRRQVKSGNQSSSAIGDRPQRRDPAATPRT